MKVNFPSFFRKKKLNTISFDFSSRYNVSETGRLSLEELKAMMEKLGAPQTHLGLKSMIKVMDLNHSVEITKNSSLEIFL